MAEKPVLVQGNEPKTVNPWSAIWFRPRAAIRTILDHDPNYQVKSIAMLVAIIQVLSGLAKTNFFDLITICIAVIIGAIFGLIGLYFFGWLYRMSGSWLGGEGQSIDVRAALAWSEIPTLFSLIIYFVVLLLLKYGLLSINLSVVVSVAFFVPFSFWAFILRCKTIGEAHRFSVWKGFFTMFAGNIAFALPFIVLAVVLAIAIPGALSTIKQPSDIVSKIPKTIPRISNVKINMPAIPTKIEASAIKMPKIPEVMQPKPSIPGISDSEIQMLYYSGEKVRIKQKNGYEFEAKILDVDKQSLYLDIKGKAINVPKNDIQSLGKASAPRRESTKSSAVDIQDKKSETANSNNLNSNRAKEE